jgi:cellulose synthase/poly-beta-1,6-N-acetylglucosamine synthase-like glycosyltransferase
MTRARDVSRLRGIVGLGLLQGLAFWWSWRQYSQLSRVQPADAAPTSIDDASHVSIVVPARNEAERIAPLLASLGRLSYPKFDVLVVDDGSTDGTAQLTLAAGFEVVRLDTVPPGWTGKNWACWTGSRHSSGDWILFLDADVTIDPLCVDAAVRSADRYSAGLLSLFLQQQCGSFWERLLLPVAYSLYFSGRRASSVNTAPRTGLANGQFLLVRRSAYLEAGGHEAVRSSVVDDVALARRFRECDLRAVILRGERYGSVRMYRSLGELRAGFSKNAIQFTQVDLMAGSRTAAAGVVSLALALRLMRGPRRVLTAVLLVANSVWLLPWFRAFGVRATYAVLHPLAVVIFQVIVFEGMLRALTGSSMWKGRRVQ